MEKNPVRLTSFIFLSGTTQTPVYTVYSKSNLSGAHWSQLWQCKYSKACLSDSAPSVLGKSKCVLEAQLHGAGLQSCPEQDT